MKWLRAGREREWCGDQFHLWPGTGPPPGLAPNFPSHCLHQRLLAPAPPGLHQTGSAGPHGARFRILCQTFRISLAGCSSPKSVAVVGVVGQEVRGAGIAPLKGTRS